MLNPKASILNSFVDSLPPAGEYHLDDATLEILDPNTAIFRAKLRGPAGSHVWARAWLWNNTDKTLAEAASSQLNAGDHVTLTVKLNGDRVPDHGSMRIESAPLRTEHVLSIKLP
jgi:hypothetical protein